MAKIIGNSLYTVKKFILERYGTEGYSRIISKIDSDSKKILMEPIMSGDYYDMKVFSQLINALGKEGGDDVLAECGIYAGKKQFSGFYGFLAKMVSIDTILQKAEGMWDKTMTEGKLRVTKKDDGDYSIHVEDFTFTDAHLIQITHFFIGIATSVTKKDYKGSCKRVDKKTTDFLLSEK